MKDELTVKQEALITSYHIVVTAQDALGQPVDGKVDTMDVEAYVLLSARIVGTSRKLGTTVSGSAVAIRSILMHVPELLKQLIQNLTVPPVQQKGKN